MPEAKKVTKNPKTPASKTVAPDKKPKAKVVVIPVSLTATYVEGSYNPKAELNIASYAEVLGAVPGTYKEIQAKLPKHTDFVGYLIRRGGLVEK